MPDDNIGQRLERCLAERGETSASIEQRHIKKINTRTATTVAWMYLLRLLHRDNRAVVDEEDEAEEIDLPEGTSVLPEPPEWKYLQRHYDFLMNSPLTRDLVYRLFSGEKKSNVSLDDVALAVRLRSLSAMTNKKGFENPYEPMYNIIGTVHGMEDFSDELFDLVAEHQSEWNLKTVAEAVHGLRNSAGIPEECLGIAKKLILKKPNETEIICMGFIPLQAEGRFYTLLDKWTDLRWDHMDTQLTPVWLQYYQQEWVKQDDVLHRLDILRTDPRRDTQSMRNFFYYFFLGERKQDVTIDDMLPILDRMILKHEWASVTLTSFTANLLWIAYAPNVWEFVRDEFRYELDVVYDMRNLVRTASLLAASPEARTAACKFLTGREKRNVTLEESLALVKDRKWMDEGLNKELEPYKTFAEAGAANASHLIPIYRKQGWSGEDISAVGTELGRLRQPSTCFYAYVEGLKADAVKGYVDVYNAHPFLTEPKRLAIIRYLIGNRDPELISELRKSAEYSQQFMGWVRQLNYFEIVPPERFVSLLPRLITAHNVLEETGQMDRLCAIKAEHSGNALKDYPLFAAAVDNILFEAVEQVLGRRIRRTDRANFKLSFDTLAALEGYHKGEAVAKAIYPNYLQGKSRFSLQDIERISGISADKPSLVLKLAADYEHGMAAKKSFPLGKEYLRIGVSGIKERMNPVEMTELLVYGLISREKDRIVEAGEKFDHELLAKARRCIKKAETFRAIKDDLERVIRGGRESAQIILKYLSERFGNAEPVADLVQGVKGLFLEQETFDYIATRMQPGNIFDLFDDRRIYCCTFMPGGKTRQASLFYLVEPELGLVHLVPVVNDSYLDPFGVAIVLNCYNREKGKVLLVDSVEGGTEVDRLKESVWKGIMYKTIMQLKEDVEAESVAFNLRVEGVKPKKFNNYLKSQTRAKPQRIYLEKIGGIETAKKYGLSQFGLEAFGKGNRVKGNVNCILVR